MTHGTPSAAAICRTNGWVAGTRLEGDDGRDVLRVVITAVGLEKVLATPIGGEPGVGFGREVCLDLSCRRWSRID